MIHVGVVASGNGLVESRLLARSVARHVPEARVTVLLMPGLRPDLAADEPFRRLAPRALGPDALEPLIEHAPHDALLAAARPLLACHLLDEGAERVLVLAADAEVYGPLDELWRALEAHDAVMVPRVGGALPEDGRRPDGRDLLDAGEIDDGIVAVRATDGGRALATWWADRTREAADAAAAHPGAAGRLTASPLSAALSAFDVVRLEDPGYDVSYWNLHARSLARTSGGVTAAGGPLRLLRWDGFRPDRPWWLSEHASRTLVLDDPVLTDLCAERSRALLRAGWVRPDQLDAAPSELPGGVRYDARLRRLHAEAEDAGEDFGDVFTPTGAEAFIAWLTEAGESGISRYARDPWRERSDLRAAYPDPEGADREEFTGWLWVHGRTEMGLQEALLPAPPEGVRVIDEHLPAVLVAGYMAGSLGLGEAARGYVAALSAGGVPVATRSIPVDPPAGRLGRVRAGHDTQAFEELRLPEGVEPEVNLLCVNADQLPALAEELGEAALAERHTIGCWAWETDFVPERWDRSFDLVDELWVYSTYVAENLARAGDVPVVVMPLPVTAPDPGDATAPYAGDEFLFLFAFDFLSTLERKNPGALIEAFKQAFAPGEGPVLLLKTINADLRPEAHERLRHAIGDRDDIRLIDAVLSRQELAALFARADCYVSLHRSEGYGLTLAEAMALEKPVIATGFGGNTDFMRPANSYLVDWTPCPVGPDAEHYPAEGTWAEPSIEHAAELMREVVTDRAEASRRGARAAREVAAALSTEAVGRLARDRLRRVAARRRQAPVPPRPAPHPELPARLGFDLEGRRHGVGGVRAAARRALFRVLRPYTLSQRRLDEVMVEALSRMDAQRAADRAAADRQRVRSALRERRVRELERGLAAVADRQEPLARSLEELAVGDLQRAVRELLDGARAIPFTAGEPFTTFEDAVAGRVLGFRLAAGSVTAPGEEYRSFEDVFRGSSERIRELVEPYVELLREHAPVLDIGCGRGELLDVLAAAGVAARGVDIDAGMAARARERGLEVVVGDALAYLDGLDEGSLGAVAAIQVVEHLPRRELARLFATARSKLRPGGRFVAETINPHAAHALKTFWVDVTHEHPLFPEVLLAMAADAGFREAFVWHPNGTGDVDADRFAQSSYAVVATA